MVTTGDLTRLSIRAALQGEAQVELQISLAPVSDRPETIRPGIQLGDCLLVETADQVHVLRVSLGPQEKLDADGLRRAGGLLAHWLIHHQVASASVSPEDLSGLGVADALEAFCEGLLLGSFRFDRYKSSVQDRPKVVVQLGHDRDAPVEEVVQRCSALASGVNLARALAEEPPNVINPLSLAERAVAVAKQDGLNFRLLGDTELADIGAGGLIAVGLGSQTPSQLIVLEYPGRGAGIGNPPVVIVGKALTFDSGGYMLKDRSAITGMKYDKCGGAAVLGVLHAAARLELETPVVGLIAAAENMVSGDAYRPGEIIRTLSGKTVEITNTDAEGRLVLADALAYACTYYRPRHLIDIATLTYGVVTALGSLRAGLMSNDDALAEALLASGERTGERLWRLPLDKGYLDLLHSDIADLKNYSGSSQASPITAGLFLQQFVPEGMPWVHLDILGTAVADEVLPYCPKGATGFGVRLLVDYLETCITSPCQP